MNTTHEAVKNQPEYGIAYRKHYKHLRSLSGQMNITRDQLKRDIANMENIILELLPCPASKIADVSGALDAYTEELERREFADKAPAIEANLLEEGEATMATKANCACSQCGHVWVCTPDNFDCPYCGDWRKPIVKRLIEAALEEGLSLDDLTELYKAYLEEEIPA